MLSQLSIINYVLIEKLQIDFHSGFTAITGETGAGKSIMLGALGLILGARADKDVVMEREKKCIIEGHFDIQYLQLEPFFEEHDLDYDSVCILRREIMATGKSRAFVNDSPIKLPLLRELGLFLMDVHSQNQNQQLNNASFRLQIVDAYCKHNELLDDYKQLYKAYQKGVKELGLLKKQHLKQSNEQEYHQFLFDELEKADIKLGEQKDLEEELQVLNHSEEIKSSLVFASQWLSVSDENIVQKTQLIIDKLSSVAAFQSEISDFVDRLQSMYIELKDIGEGVSLLEDQLFFDSTRMEFINTRLDELFTLARKHGLNGADELVEYQNTLSEKIHSVFNLDEKINTLEKKLAVQFDKLSKYATQMSETRLQAALNIDGLMVKNLVELGMENADFKIELKDLQDLGPDGKDEVVFLFKANSGSKLAEINKVASGGELSRIMLSVKSILANKQALPAIIFDEIDSGVSGEIADKLASLMNGLGEHMQVISITHLPQIASKANHHYLVYKENDSIFTRSKIKELDKQQRVSEVAAMLSGSNIVDSAIEHARELLGYSDLN